MSPLETMPFLRTEALIRAVEPPGTMGLFRAGGHEFIGRKDTLMTPKSFSSHMKGFSPYMKGFSPYNNAPEILSEIVYEIVSEIGSEIAFPKPCPKSCLKSWPKSCPKSLL